MTYRPTPHTVDREHEPAQERVTIDPDATIVPEYDEAEFRRLRTRLAVLVGLVGNLPSDPSMPARTIGFRARTKAKGRKR
jgi:hypothetical protein